MQHHNTAPATTIAKCGDAGLDPRVCGSPPLAQIWRAVRSFGAWASKVGQSRHNVGTLEAAVWSMKRPAYAFGWVWRVGVEAPAGCGYCESWNPGAPYSLTHNGYTGLQMDRTGVSSGAKLTLDEPGLVCSTIIPPQQQQSQNAVTPGSIRVCVARLPWLRFGVRYAVLVLGHPK